MEQVKIRLQNISKSYYSETAVTQALRKINLEFSMGEFVAITGESGSGKSTLLNIIGGMDTFDEGEMFVDGEPTFQYDDQDWEAFRRNKIGYIFQDYSLVGHYTALDNVMSALLILGVEKKDARETAMKYLAQVGLAGYETHRASELSSGQKQRLSIARALAKNTEIIVADEPTGNLDSETGNQIIQLLKELSKDKLVIMVTHNYDQAEPYVTRKVRVHDGQIISDVPVNSREEESDSSKEPIPAPEHKAVTFKRQNQIAGLFARRNFQTQKARAALFIVFLLIISSVSFLFIGELFMHKDDYSTRQYSQDTFYQEDDTRLVIKRKDGKDIVKEDKEAISKLSGVAKVDTCDLANDINFYMDEGVDYKYLYAQSWDSDKVATSVQFLNEKRLMQSTDCITEADLSKGRLPKSRNEIVLYSQSGSKYGQEIMTYFKSHNIWGNDQYYGTKLKVVGLLKEPSDQVYFSKDMCHMLSMRVDSGIYRLLYSYDESLEDYKCKPDLIPVIADDLEGNTVRVSEKLEEKPSGEIEFTYQEKDDQGKEIGEIQTGIVSIDGSFHEYTAGIMEVSQEFFDRYYTKNSDQASVYIVSYAVTDSVIKKLDKLGYDAISTFRVSATEYKEDLVNQRLIIICISAFGLLAILFAEILILRSLMKIRIKDYFVLKFIGMKMRIIRSISYFEMLLYTAIAVLVTIVIMWILRLAGVGIVEDIMWYYSPLTYILFILYNILLILLTVGSFNRILKGRLNS